ncbi:MAG: M20/M25/M40 family metallo-hydrolase [Gammaproteobacteria bacterium]|nr:M20/M25/M40 family metallo-hydrolase [Gammaproteobacteria bacterium]MDH4254540.1 M20/M25/M40 family metallo-hydrolase [Gammaproteobacteria bacterium]MDH5310390.1 M20/M25/M40 family metallo-hydrolase [Gammaproteobacteria bacterium]
MMTSPTSKAGSLTRRRFVAAGGLTASAALLPPWARARAAMLPGEALALAEARRDELVELLAGLVRIRSQSGESAEQAQAVVRDYLGRLPYRVEASADRPSDYESHPEFMPPSPAGDGPFVNVVGWPEGSTASGCGLFSHIDTHLVEDGWETDPYEPVQRDGRLYGLGTADDKGGVAAMLVAAAALASVGGPLPVVMSLHGKGGGSRGSLPVFERLRRSGQVLDAVLYVHPAETGRGLDDIKNEVQGILDLELRVRGWRGEPLEVNSIDSAPWEDGGNAIDACWKMLGRLRNGAFAGTSINVGQVTGGDRIGSVADSASARLRLKFSEPHTWSVLLDVARAEIGEFLDAYAGAGQQYAIELEPVGYRTNPGSADWDGPASRVLREAIEDLAGKAPAAYPNHYAGDIRYPIRLLGTPAYGIGSLAGGFYGPNEWVDVDDLVRLVAVVIATVTGWSGL